MGILRDFRKLVFGAKAVSKHAADQAGEKIEEKKSDLVDKTEQMLDELSEEFSEKSTGAKTKLQQEAKEVWDKTKEKSSRLVEDIKESEAYKQTSETLERVGDALLDTGEKFYEKTKEVLEGPGKEMAEKAKEISEDLGEKIMTAGKGLMGKAKDLAEDLEGKFERTVKKAEEEAALEKNKPKSEFADTPLDAGGSTLEGKDEFFDKAARYAEGSYSDKPELLKDKIVEPKETLKKPIPGFSDEDQDGDELIDDAEIIEDEPK